MKNITDYLKVFKNIETYKGPGPRNMADGGRIGFATGSPGADMQEILDAYKTYKRSHYSGGQKYPIIPFR